MELPDDAPKFPKLPFLAGDAALIAVAFYLAVSSGSPLPAAAIYSIAACVSLGALLAAIPFVIDYNRRQEALLTERQSALEALARTTSTAAEQASIAAGGLHEIAELAHKNLRLAEHLPQKLHERINEFNRAQDEALAAELEALQQEVNTLRASEAEKLDSAADKVQRSAAELLKLESGLRAQIQAFEATARQARESLAQGVADAVERLEQMRTAAPPPPPSAPGTVSVAVEPAPSRREPPPPPPAAPAAQPPSSPPPAERASRGPAAPEPASAVEVHPGSKPGTVAVPVSPVAPPPPPGARKPLPKRRPDQEATPWLGGLLTEEPPAAEAPPVRRPARHAPATAGAEPATRGRSAAPATVSAEGATRLIATAYIGIGNKLFVRGEGPGLSWERGVPLQFVSIGKWRWESTQANQPVVVKLFKNDEIECTALGAITLQPGHLHEVTAEF